MANRHIALAQLGWNEWFEEREKCGPADTIARVAAIDRDLLLLMDQTGTFRAQLAGRYLYRHHLSQELPCVGDWVCVEKHPTDDFGLVHMLLERRTALRRKSAGDSVEYQMIAANVDYAIIVQSCHYDFNLKRLERYLVMVRDGGADPCVLLTKTDLVEPEVLSSQLAEIRAAGVTAPVLTLSNVTREGLDDLKRSLLPAKTYCFVGSSGVGKSTIINQLLGRERLQTKGVSGTGEGRHTTVRRELIILESGALVIDNPGMREFGILGAENGIGDSFSDIIGFASDCRYRNCSHTGEPGCAVLEAIHSGALLVKSTMTITSSSGKSLSSTKCHMSRRERRIVTLENTSSPPRRISKIGRPLARRITLRCKRDDHDVLRPEFKRWHQINNS